MYRFISCGHFHSACGIACRTRKDFGPELVELPCEPDVSLRDIETIARIVKQVAQADRRD